MQQVARWARLILVLAGVWLATATGVSCSSNQDNNAVPTGGSSSSGGNTSVAGTGGGLCPTGFIPCNGFCVNPMVDAANCGMCGKTCGAGQLCNGTCTCQAGLMGCATGCTNIKADGANCGACGTACPATTPYCSNSACVATCPAGQTQCGTGCLDAASFQTDPLNCGACGKACGAGQSCSGGVCSCPANQQACGGSCVDVMTNAAHCGACNMACAAGGACQAGKCSGGGGGGAGGGGAGGSGSTDRPAGCPAAASLLSDFEEGSGVLVKQGGRDGWWYVFADMVAGQQTPTSSTKAIPAAPLTPPGGDCNKYALHSTANGHPQYVGFGATLSPGTSASTKKAVSLETYGGISFKIKSGSGNAPSIWFEMLTKETQPADLSGTAKNDQVDAYNTRGTLLTGIGTEWKTFTIPFSVMAPRYLPSDCDAGVLCEAPAFNSKNVLGLQFSLYDQFSSSGAYDLWVDDVNLVAADVGFPTYTQSTGKYPFPQDKAMGNGCVKPTGATGKQLIDAYLKWKKTFVVTEGGSMRVKSPEIDNGATVSEGIAYGMLIAVYMNDQPLFDGLFKYWKDHPSSGLLMNWKIPGGSGSATDSDEDAGFALIQASKQWGGTYLQSAKDLIGQMAEADIEGGSVLKPGNQFGGASLTNPSYFAPAYYRLFATVDTAHATQWNAVLASTYQYLNKIEGDNGLVPAWCSNSCGSRGGGSYADNDKYQYDSHRTPWRMALDVCWNNNADAKDYVTKITKTFAGKSDTEGLGAVADIYDASGNPTANSKPNSMSIIGTAAVGAMASGSANQALVNRMYQYLLDASYNGDPIFEAQGYTYYNATVGLLTALTLTGNFNNFE
jgi:endoglucanase